MKPVFLHIWAEQLKELCIKFEHYETDQWAVDTILDELQLNNQSVVADVCTGTGILAKAALARGCKVFSSDIRYWGYEGTQIIDFLHPDPDQEKVLREAIEGHTVFINPPFKTAAEFVEQAFNLGANMVISFQRFAWMESGERRDFWDNHPPVAVYLCGGRATCWRHDIPKKKRKSGSSTAHAWFIFTKYNYDYPCQEPVIRRLYKPKS